MEWNDTGAEDHQYGDLFWWPSGVVSKAHLCLMARSEELRVSRRPSLGLDTPEISRWLTACLGPMMAGVLQGGPVWRPGVSAVSESGRKTSIES